MHTGLSLAYRRMPDIEVYARAEITGDGDTAFTNPFDFIRGPVDIQQDKATPVSYARNACYSSSIFERSTAGLGNSMRSEERDSTRISAIA